MTPNEGIKKILAKLDQFFFIQLRLLIISAPVLYGLLGKLFSPFFYFYLAFLTYLGIRQRQQRPAFVYEKIFRVSFYLFTFFLFLQALPLPSFLLRIISKSTNQILQRLMDNPPSFHASAILPSNTFVSGLQFMVLALFFLMLISTAWNKEQMFRLLKTMVLSAAIMVVAAFGGILGPEAARNGNFFLSYLLIVFPLVPALLLLRLDYFETSRPLIEKIFSEFLRRAPVILYTALGILFTVAIGLSRNRPAILFMGISLVIFSVWVYYFKRPQSIRRNLKKIFIAICIIAVLLGIQQSVKHLLNSDAHGFNEGDRWRRTLSMARAFPLCGCGLGNAQHALLYFDSNFDIDNRPYSNSGYLMLLAETGVTGLIPLLILLGLPVITIIKTGWKRKHPQVKLISIGIAVSLLVALLHFLFNASLLAGPLPAVFLTIAALGIKIVNYKR